MLSRRMLSLVVGAMLAGRLAGLSAQETTAAPQAADTTVQGYVPDARTEVPEATVAPAAAPAPAPAAAPAAPVALTGRAAIGAQLGFIDVLPARSPERLRGLLDDATALERESGLDLADALAEKEKVKGMINSAKQEVSSIDSKRKVADKNKDEAGKVALEAEKKDAERRKQFLERRLSLHESEIDRAKAAQKVAGTMTRALQLELELASRRNDRRQTAGYDPAATRRHDAVILELEGRGLEAKRTQAEAEKQLADKDVDIAKRRLELHKAQVAAAGQ